jgi:hypothetical protein
VVLGLSLINWDNVRVGLYATTDKSGGYITITDNTFDYLSANIEFYETPLDTATNTKWEYCEIARNTISHASHIEGTSSYFWTEVNITYGHSTDTNDHEGIGTQDLQNSSIHHNVITGTGRGIVMYAGRYNTSHTNSIYNNYIDMKEGTLTAVRGMVLTPYHAATSGYYGNEIYSNVIASDSTGIYASNVP